MRIHTSKKNITTMMAPAATGRTSAPCVCCTQSSNDMVPARRDKPCLMQQHSIAQHSGPAGPTTNQWQPTPLSQQQYYPIGAASYLHTSGTPGKGLLQVSPVEYPPHNTTCVHLAALLLSNSGAVTKRPAAPLQPAHLAMTSILNANPTEPMGSATICLPGRIVGLIMSVLGRIRLHLLSCPSLACPPTEPAHRHMKPCSSSLTPQHWHPSHHKPSPC